jgi:2-hydroxy-6-oxonona-2,4-dienedioate hydrolase
MVIRHKQKRPASLSSRCVKVDGWRMHYRTGGTGAQAVVLVHGLTVSGNYLLPTAVELMRDFTVYIPDLPGFGQSEKPQQALSIVELAESLKAWMDAVGLERAYLLGNSMGCHTIAVLASRYRERVAGAILVSPVGERDVLNTLPLVARALNDFVREPPSSWVVMFKDLLKAGLRRTVLTLRNMQRFPLEPRLPQVQVPALVVGGKHDRIVPMWSIGRVTALLPQGRVAVLAEAAHVPNYTHPQQMAALVRAFVDSTSRRK